MKELFQKFIERLTCKHEWGEREYMGYTYMNRVDLMYDVRTHVYVQKCTKCGKTRVSYAYEQPVAPEDKKR